jgi:hypothetical protein
MVKYKANNPILSIKKDLIGKASEVYFQRNKYQIPIISILAPKKRILGMKKGVFRQ